MLASVTPLLMSHLLTLHWQKPGQYAKVSIGETEKCIPPIKGDTTKAKCVDGIIVNIEELRA